MKFSGLVALTLIGGASAFSPVLLQQKMSTKLFNGPGHVGAGGMADTRDPNALVHEDARKSIGVAPSFEEYMKQRAGGAPAAPAAAAAPAPAAPAPVAAAPAPAAGRPAAWSPGGAAAAAPAYAAPAAAAPAYAAPAAAAPAAAAGGGVLDTLASLEGPGQVWGADGIAVGKEESDFKEFDNFNLFFDRLNASGVAAELAGAGPFTVFAPVNSAVETYEMMKGPVDAAVCRFQIVKGVVASGDVSSADLSTLAGIPLTYRYAVRKHFINDAIVGEKTFGPFSDYPVDVACGNGVVHGMSVVLQQ